MPEKKVFVSGCFDLLHSGHVAFFQEAARYGDLYVALGSDKNVFLLKNRPPVNTEAERLFMIQALSCVHTAFVSRGSGILDFADELREIHPDYFIVNEDGSTPEKAQLCADLGIEYVVLKRIPAEGLQARSTTALRGFSTVPESVTLAGACFDQAQISSLAPGAALTLSLHGYGDFSSPARSAAIELWGSRLPVDRPDKLTKIFFGFRNLPGSDRTAGAAEAVGLAYPGLTRAEFSGAAWPTRMQSETADGILRFLENTLYLRQLPAELAVSSCQPAADLTVRRVLNLAEKVDAVWQGLLAQDLHGFGLSLRASFEAQQAVCRHPASDRLMELLPDAAGVIGWQVSGAYLLFAAEHPPENSLRISIRRADD